MKARNASTLRTWRIEGRRFGPSAYPPAPVDALDVDDADEDTDEEDDDEEEVVPWSSAHGMPVSVPIPFAHMLATVGSGPQVVNQSLRICCSHCGMGGSPRGIAGSARPVLS
jgi:hypothetical protein